MTGPVTDSDAPATADAGSASAGLTTGRGDGSSAMSGDRTGTGGSAGGSGGTVDSSATSGESTSTSGASSSATGSGTSGVDLPPQIPPEALALVELINDYRGENGLPAIALCPSLATVAQTHCIDLVEQQPHLESGCNLHSWSDAGPWMACCYTPDHAQAQCMWDKPRELTAYAGNGYEISASGASQPDQALSLWQGSSGHNEVILSQGIWADHPWACIGAGMYGGFAHVWFGEEDDPG